MVREGEVGAAALDVEAHAEVVEGDGHALDVPAGAAGAEGGAVPAGLALAGRHPQHRVDGVLLARTVRVAASLGGQQPHGGGVEMRDRAEVRVGLDGEVDVAFQLVGGAEVAQPFHERDDAGYRLDGAYVLLRREHPQGGHVLAEEGGLLLGEGDPVDAVALRAFEEGVVDVGDVLDVVDLPLGVEPHALDEVERVVGRRMTHVGRVVRGDAADVDAGDGTGLEGDQAAGRGVVDPQVAALTRQGGDLGSGPGMHVHEPNRPRVANTTGIASDGRLCALVSSIALCSRGTPARPHGYVTRAARGSPATRRRVPGALRRRAGRRRGRGWRRVPRR